MFRSSKTAVVSKPSAPRGGPVETLDFDDEARKLWARLNLDPRAIQGNKWNPVDAIWRHPSGCGTIFVGNQTAAENIQMLRQLGITHVVNCTVGSSQIPNFHENKDSGITYFRFPISFWSSNVDQSDASVVAFMLPMFTFVEEAVASGGCVLVHCLAGAHRAGTTGCALLMHFADMDVYKAVHTAKQLRPIIEPIGTLGMFLQRFQKARTSPAGTILNDGPITRILRLERKADEK